MFNSIHLSSIQWSVASKVLFYSLHGLFDQSTNLIENMRLRELCFLHKNTIHQLITKKNTHTYSPFVNFMQQQKK